jgi:hypothetical protein
MNVCHLFCLIKYSSCSSRLAQPAQWYHPVSVLSQTHLSDTRSSPDSEIESAKPKNKEKNSIKPETPCIFSQPDIVSCRE